MAAILDFEVANVFFFLKRDSKGMCIQNLVLISPFDQLSHKNRLICPHYDIPLLNPQNSIIYQPMCLMHCQTVEHRYLKLSLHTQLDRGVTWAMLKTHDRNVGSS